MFSKTARVSFLLLLVSVCGSALAKTGPPRKTGPKGTRSLRLGGKMPPFRLPGVDGKVHTDTEYSAAKVLVVVFTCNHCPTAQAYEQRIIRLDADYRDKGVRLIAVSPNDPNAVRLDELGYSDLGDSLDDMKIRAKHRGFTFPYLYDGQTQEFSRKLGVKATPQVFIFDAGRRLRYIGRIDNSDVGKVTTRDARNAVDDLLTGRDVRTATTRAFGCSTKWSAKRRSVKAADERWAKMPVHLRDIDASGLRQVLRDQGRNHLLIHIWSTRDGAAAKELPELVTMHRMYARRPFRLFTISLDKAGDRDRALSLLKKHSAATTNYLYTGRDVKELARVLGANWKGAVPHTLFLAPGGAEKMLYSGTGPFDPLDLRRTIADNLGRTYAAKRTPRRDRRKETKAVDPLSGVSPDQRRRIEKAIPRRAPAAPGKPRKLLVIGLNIGRGGHPSIPHANLAVKLMGAKTGAYQAVFGTDRSMLKPQKLKQFDAVFLNNTIGPIFNTPELRKSFSAFLSDGGGLVANHAATVTSTDWAEFGEILGARGAAHRDADEKVTIRLDDPDSPLNAAFGGKSFELADEIFRFRAPYSREKVRVLLSIDVAKTDMNQGRPRGACIRKDNDYAISWIRRHGKGRVFYCSLGHNPYVFWSPAMLKHFLAGIQFALGDLKADATEVRQAQGGRHGKAPANWRGVTDERAAR